MLFDDLGPPWPIHACYLARFELDGDAENMIAAARRDGVLVASGTATLEAALLGKPMVIAYRMSPWSWRIMRSNRGSPA